MSYWHLAMRQQSTNIAVLNFKLKNLFAVVYMYEGCSFKHNKSVILIAKFHVGEITLKTVIFNKPEAPELLERFVVHRQIRNPIITFI